MSINTEPNQKQPSSEPTKQESGLSFIKEKLGLYIVIFIGILVIGKAIAQAGKGELWTQGMRNIVSVALLFGVLCIGLVNAQLAFLALLLYTPFVDALPGRFGGEYTALNLFNLLSGIAILCWFVDKVKKQRAFLIQNSGTKFAFLFGLFSVLSYIINGFGYGTDYLKYHIFTLKRWLDPILLFFITTGMTYRRDLRKDALSAVLLGVAMVIFLAIKDVSQISHFSWDRRVAGVGNQPNMLGAFCVDYMFLFVGIVLVNFRKIIYWVGILPFVWGIRAVTVSFSRGAYASFIVASLTIAFIKNKILFIACLLLFVFIATNLWVLPQAVQERIEMTIAGEELYGYGIDYEQSAEGRIEAWKATLNLIVARPILGFGIGMVGTYLTYHAGILIGDVHNSYLLLAAEYGLVTLGIFLGCLFAGVKVGWFIFKHSPDEIFKGAGLGFVVGIVGLMVNCFFGSHMTTLWEIGYFWVLLAIFANEEKELRLEIRNNESVGRTSPKTR